MNSTQASKYLASGGDHCPYCGSEGCRERWNTNFTVADNKCLNCSKTWTDHYTLTGVDGFKRVTGK